MGIAITFFKYLPYFIQTYLKYLTNVSNITFLTIHTIPRIDILARFNQSAAKLYIADSQWVRRSKQNKLYSQDIHREWCILRVEH